MNHKTEPWRTSLAGPTELDALLSRVAALRPMTREQREVYDAVMKGEPINAFVLREMLREWATRPRHGPAPKPAFCSRCGAEVLGRAAARVHCSTKKGVV